MSPVGRSCSTCGGPGTASASGQPSPDEPSGDRSASSAAIAASVLCAAPALALMSRLYQATPMALINQILVPTDFSDHAGEAMGYAAEISEKFHAPILILHVYASP